MEQLKSRKGFMFTLVTVVLVVLMLGEITTYIYTNMQFGTLTLESTPSFAATSMYTSIKAQTPGFLQKSLKNAFYALSYYETSNQINHPINSSQYALASLMTNGTLYGTNLTAQMGTYTLNGYYSALALSAKRAGLNATFKNSNIIIFQTQSGAISASFISNLNVSSGLSGQISYPISVNVSVPISGLPDIYGANLGTTGYITYTSNKSALVNTNYSSLATGSIYKKNSVTQLTSTASSGSLSPYLFSYGAMFVDNSVAASCTDQYITNALNRSNYILVTNNANNINSIVCGFAGLITLTTNTVPYTKPYLSYVVPSQNYVNITVHNTQSAATSTNFQQMISFNPSNAVYRSYESSDLGNIRFFQGATELYSWCESGCNSTTSTNAVFWVNIPSSIAGSGTAVISMVFSSASSEYDGVYAGESPQLSSTYGKYDNGKNVFLDYFNNSYNPIATVVGGGSSLGTATLGSYSSLPVVVVSGFPGFSLSYPSAQQFPSNFIAETFVMADGGAEDTGFGASGSSISTLGYVMDPGDFGNGYLDMYRIGPGGSAGEIGGHYSYSQSSNTWYLNELLHYSNGLVIGYQKAETNSLDATGSPNKNSATDTTYTTFNALMYRPYGGGTDFWIALARALPPNGVMPTTTQNALQSGRFPGTFNTVNFVQGSQYIIDSNTLSEYDPSPVQSAIDAGAYSASSFSPTYLSLMSGVQAPISPYGVAPLGLSERQVLSLGGSANVVANALVLNTISGGGDTVSFWMQWPSSQTNKVPITLGPYSFYITSSAMGLSTSGSNLLGVPTYGLSTFTTTPWVQVVATLTNGVPSASADSVYIDGARQSIQVISGSFGSQTNNGVISIGGVTSGSYNNFVGQLADVQVYNTILNPYQAEQLYLNGINSGPINYTYLAGWWPLNGNSNDYSPFHDNGIISGTLGYERLADYAGDTLDGGSFYRSSVSGVEGLSQCYNIGSCAWSGTGKVYVPVQQSYATNAVVSSSSALGFINNTLPSSTYFNFGENALFVASNIPTNSAGSGYDTVSFWMDLVPDGNTVTPAYFSNFGVAGTSTCFGLSTLTGSTVGIKGVATNTISNRWVNIIAVLYNNADPSSGGNSALYVNGTSASLSSCSSGSMSAGSTTPGSSVYIGGMWTVNTPFAGSLADVQVYNTPLSSSQAASLYLNNTVPGIKPAGWWPLNTGAKGFSNQTSALYGNTAVEYSNGKLCTEANSLSIIGNQCGIGYLPFGPR